MPSSSSTTRRNTGGNNASAATAAAAASKTTQEEQEKLTKDALLALSAICGAALLLKALAASLTVYIAMVPLLYIYGVNTCPPSSSFDAKAQLRTVLSGEALPDDHPDKPKSGTIAGFFAQAKAAITSELATLPGYEVDIMSFGGAALFATVTMPTADLECYWLGCNHRWYYWGSKKISEMNNVAVAGVSQNKEGRNVYRPPESANVKIGNTNIKFNFKED